ncbi:MAG: glycosyltransferase [Candidatus Omnitrophica bacterium]|nr:glycosyltransferase [Candidatus Omnitrophota bacterium]
MRVIFITREGYNQPGGRIRSYGFARELKKRGVDTEVFSFADNLGAKAGDRERNFAVRQKLPLIFKGIKHLFSKRNCLFVVNRFNYHSFSPWMCSLINKNPYIFDMDDWEAREDLGYYLGLLPKSKAEFLTRVFAKRSKLCIAASSYLEGYLSKINKKVYKIPTGVDLEAFKPKTFSKNNRKVIFSWHGLINRKDTLEELAFMMRCFLSVNKKFTSTELWIKGSGIFIEDFLKLLAQLNSPNIKYIPWSSPDSIPSYLDSVDIGLFPLLKENRFNLSRSPTKVFEYMAKNIPVIASRIGEAEHIIRSGDNGFLALNKDEFIFSMQTLIDKPGIRHALAEKAYEYVKDNYSLDILCQKFYRIFSEYFG